MTGRKLAVLTVGRASLVGSWLSKLALEVPIGAVMAAFDNNAEKMKGSVEQYCSLQCCDYGGLL